MAGILSPVVFQAQCSETRPGEVVFVAGGHDALGSWAPAMAVPLATCAKSFPLWSSEPVLLPAGKAVDFKFLVQAEDRTGKTRWEEGGLKGNRAVTPVEKMKVTSKGTWGRPDTESSTAPAVLEEHPLGHRKLTREDEDLARQTEERMLVIMAESTKEAAAAEVGEVQPMAATLEAREPMKRNFSQSLFNLPSDSSLPSCPTADDSSLPEDEAELLQSLAEDSSPTVGGLAEAELPQEAPECAKAIGDIEDAAALQPLSKGKKKKKRKNKKKSADSSPTGIDEAEGELPQQVVYLEAEAEEAPAKPEAAPKRGMRLKHINSLTALSLMADSQEKHDARAHDTRAQPLYRSHNLAVPVVVVTSEFSPWSKTGGLGLVAASYSYEFPRSGHRTMVVSPKYKNYDNLQFVGETEVVVNGRKELVKYLHKWMEVEDGRGCDCVFVEHPAISKDGGLYNDDAGREYPDNLFRFTLLSLAAMEAPLILRLGGSTYGDKVVFLANDWQAGLVPLYMCHKYRPHGTYSQARVIYVVHNLGYQGQYHGCNACHFFGVDKQAADDLALGKCVNLSKGALICADRVITVSPNYANEIQTPGGGFGLQDFVRAKAHALRLAGILNGVDDCWNPETDKSIAANFSVDDFEEGKAKNKAALQRELNLVQDPHCVLIAFVGRLTWQKGVDVIGTAISWLMQEAGNGVTGHAQLIMMGNGQREYAETLRWAEGSYPGRVCGYVGFDPQVEHRIMAGCDLFLMPSRYEPCGLPQMYSQRYGTLPIVTATGGLKDTVKDLSEGPNTATGFQIPHPSPDKLKEVLYRAAELFLKRPAEFRCMQRTAMLADFGWPRAMDEYERHIDLALVDPPTSR